MNAKLVAAFVLSVATSAAWADATTKAETAETLAIALLIQQFQAAAAPLNALNAQRQDAAVTLATVDALERENPVPPAPALWWPLVQNLDRGGLLALALAAQAQAAASAGFSRDVWQLAALNAANGLVSRLGG